MSWRKTSDPLEDKRAATVMSKLVSVILPTLNEAANLPTLIPMVADALRSADLHSYEFVVVDDSSADGTADVARALSKEFAVRVVERSGGRGLATAILAGIRAAEGDVVVVMDADHSHPPESVPTLVRTVLSDGETLAIGSRYIQGGGITANWPWHRRLISRCASALAFPLTRIRDPLSGFFAARRTQILPILNAAPLDGFKILLEVLASGKAALVEEVPIQFSDRRCGSSKLTTNVAFAYGRQLARLYSSLSRAALGRRVEAGPRLGHADRQSYGFTLVELLVVIAIVGLVAALLLPAVNAAREAGRRNTCTSRIRSLALAVANYHVAHGGYPQSRFKVPQDVGPESRSWSWIVRVLPFIEEQALYDQLDIGKSRLMDKTELIARPLPILLCPSDAFTVEVSRIGAGHFPEMALGVTNYKAVCGANWGADETQKTDDIGTRWRNIGFNGSYDGQARGDGIIWRDDYQYRMTEAKVKDGLGKTLLLGEDVPEYNSWNSWAYTSHTFGTCAIPPTLTADDPMWWPDAMGFRSLHPKVVQFAYADGSVRSIDIDISSRIYRSLGTRREK